MQLTDAHILSIAGGDKESFRLLYETVFPSLILFSHRFTDVRNEAADMVQETLLVFWDKRIDFKGVDEAKAFLYGTLKNKCMNHLRSKKVHERYVQKQMVEAVQNPESVEESYEVNRAVIEDEAFVLLYRALAELPPREKEVLELSIQGRKNQDIADSLGLSVNTIKTLKLRAYRKIRELIG
ncbi:MAG: sigma-70 family RNA polymerase sigma factor [Bacteroidales bacterium]|nr:sigma-70 family RNA polymerase sigma factor [Bacteroidales bacterium]